MIKNSLICCAALLSGLACSEVTDTANPLTQLLSEKMHFIDLTHALSVDAPFWPSTASSPFRHDTLRAHPSGAPAMAAYATPEHFGTHIDAPIHSGDHLLSVDQLMADDLFGQAAVIDVSVQCQDNPDYLLSKADILAWETTHGPLPEGAIVLMATGWSKKWPDQAAYRNQDVSKVMHFPGFSEQAGRFLIEERSIRGIGVDTFSIDFGPSQNFPVHKSVNGAGKYHLENVANLHLLPAKGAYLIVAPIKIAGGSGGQVRIFAAVPE